MSYHIKNRDKLLSDIADGLRNKDALADRNQTRLGAIEVIFYEDETEVFTASLSTALHYLAEDLYWDEKGDWSNADRATVRSL